MNTPTPDSFTPYLIPADLSTRRCVDERHTTQQIKGAQLPGGSYYELDMLKRLAHLDETGARDRVQQTGHMGVHDDEHHGAAGCGYGKLVQNEPAIVSATESVAVTERHAWATSHGAVNITYFGTHDPQVALINLRPDTTLDTNGAWKAGVHAFNCDVWMADQLAGSYGLPVETVRQDLTDTYRKTVERLAPGTVFITII